MRFFNPKPKSKQPMDDPLVGAPKFCSKDGKELIYKEEYEYDIYSGEQYIAYRFLYCPDGHGDYQWLRDTWVFLNEF